MNEIMKSALTAPSDRGGAALWWLGQMGLMVRIGRTVLMIDYYATPSPARLVPPPIPAEEVEGVDLFLGTHDHSDHIDHDAWRVWAGSVKNAKFAFPALHEDKIALDGIGADRRLPLNDGQSVTVGDVTVHAVAAAHEFLDMDEKTGFYPCLQYVIKGGGVTILHAGDTLRYEGMLGKLAALGPFDCAILPINGRDGKRYRRNCIGNMTFQEAADLAGELGIRRVIPGHWDMFANNPGDPEAFADYLAAKYEGKVVCAMPGRGREESVVSGQ